MTYKLRTKLLEAQIDHPLSNYQNSRFDWTGKISSVTYRGIPVTITEKLGGIQEHKFGKGLYNEFSMNTALGFEEANIGDWFHKIGVGLLKKDTVNYEFQHHYEVKPAHFIIHEENDRLIIECISEKVNGFAYHLTKEIMLSDNQLRIHYSLKNTGDKMIEAQEYAHNFLAVNNTSLSPNYILTLPFHLQKNSVGDGNYSNSLLEFCDNNLHFLRSTRNQFMVCFVNKTETVKAHWKLIHKEQKIGMSETTSFPASKINVWGWGHVISPELFLDIALNPGDTEEWSRTYHFFNVD